MALEEWSLKVALDLFLYLNVHFDELFRGFSNWSPMEAKAAGLSACIILQEARLPKCRDDGINPFMVHLKASVLTDL